jgi:hypothetical protein
MDGTVATSGDRHQNWPGLALLPRGAEVVATRLETAARPCCFSVLGLVLGGKMRTLCHQNMGKGIYMVDMKQKQLRSKHPVLCLDFVQSTQQETGSRHGDKTREKDTNNMWFCQCGSESNWIGED